MPTSRMPRVISLAVLLLLAIALSATAGAQTWAESGDAGDLPWSVQTPAGLYALNQITGTLSGPEDMDLYCIEVLDPAVFSASVVCAGMADPSIWIFRFTGLGVAHNDVCMGGGKTIPVGMFGIGTYHVAVGSAGRQSLAGTDPIWIPNLLTGPRAPDGPGAAGNLSAWTGTSGFYNGNYTINLPGASYCGTAVPTEEHGWGSLKSIYR